MIKIYSEFIGGNRKLHLYVDDEKNHNLLKIYDCCEIFETEILDVDVLKIIRIVKSFKYYCETVEFLHAINKGCRKVIFDEQTIKCIISSQDVEKYYYEIDNFFEFKYKYNKVVGVKGFKKID